MDYSFDHQDRYYADQACDYKPKPCQACGKLAHDHEVITDIESGEDELYCAPCLETL